MSMQNSMGFILLFSCAEPGSKWLAHSHPHSRNRVHHNGRRNKSTVALHGLVRLPFPYHKNQVWRLIPELSCFLMLQVGRQTCPEGK